MPCCAGHRSVPPPIMLISFFARHAEAGQKKSAESAFPDFPRRGLSPKLPHIEATRYIFGECRRFHRRAPYTSGRHFTFMRTAASYREPAKFLASFPAATLSTRRAFTSTGDRALDHHEIFTIHLYRELGLSDARLGLGRCYRCNAFRERGADDSREARVFPMPSPPARNATRPLNAGPASRIARRRRTPR